MSFSTPDLDQGLTAFGAFLEAEYGRPFADWCDSGGWTDRESLQVSRALGLLLKEPIADVAARAPADRETSETGAHRIWVLNDAKIAGSAWEGRWQWQLLADIDNAAKSASGQMMTPSDPRLYLFTIRYERDFFALLAGHFQEFLCDRPGLARCADGSAVADLLRQIPGFQAASPIFLAGALLLITKLGRKGFCAWCEERCDAKDDDAA
ncbi:hypothetical protein [Methylovirgula sp. HY1]|uniref:hypothetical protein n=1 Tax=Methylovirgula sp. HY1 TaxID=2822761 RepID=UPI001C5B4FA8|nr:hypothetical protein [Methylovirgula sp. HY1]QXX75149.1 hypothetical protein MHY1_01968 [Methylovirgula sp. HY1]